MPVEHPRLRRERRTIQALIEIYCREQHGERSEHRRSERDAPSGKLCAGCQSLEDYALARLARCPFQENKPVCVKCAVHCYQPEMRQRVRIVMRFAGPRMLLRHPLLAIRHLLDERRKPRRLKSSAGKV